MTGEAAAAVRAELEREEEFLLDLTRQLVRIPTVNPKFEADAALNTPLGHGLVRAIVDSRAAQGQDTEIRGFTAVCDAAHYAAAGIPGVIFGPGGDGFHGPNEYVDLDSLKAVTRTLADATLRWCGVR